MIYSYDSSLELPKSVLETGIYKYIYISVRHDVSIYITEPKMQDLSQPDDLLIHLPMWAESSYCNFDENNEVGLVECEVEIGQGHSSPSSSYPRSPGSTGDNSDYSSGILC